VAVTEGTGAVDGDRGNGSGDGDRGNGSGDGDRGNGNYYRYIRLDVGRQGEKSYGGAQEIPQLPTVLTSTRKRNRSQYMRHR